MASKKKIQAPASESVVVQGQRAGKATAAKKAIEDAGKKAIAKKPAKKKPAPKKKVKKAAPEPAPVAEVKRPVGRPPEYRDEYCKYLIEFFNIDVQRVEEIPVADSKAKDGVRMQKEVIVNTFPTLTRFASKIDVTRKTLHEWATDTDKAGNLRRPEFSYAYARAKDLQESLIVEGGMSGAYESRFAGLAAKNLVGWRDQVEQKIEQNITTTSREELDNIYAMGMEQAQAGRAVIEQRKAAKQQGKKAAGKGRAK